VEVIQNSTKTASYCDKANSCLVNSSMWDLIFRLTYLRYTTRHLPVVRGVFVRSDVSARSVLTNFSSHALRVALNVLQTNLVSMLLITLFHTQYLRQLVAGCRAPRHRDAAGGMNQLMTRWRPDYVAGYAHTPYFTFQCIQR
jgi:hypothetical protein